MCHNTDQNRLIETKSEEESEIGTKSQMTGKPLKTKVLQGIKKVLPEGIEPSTNGLRVLCRLFNTNTYIGLVTSE